MKFRKSPYYLFMYLTGIVFSVFVIVGGIVLTIIDPYGIIELHLLQILLGGIILFETLRIMRPISCPWIFFSNAGVSRHANLGPHIHIPWEECTEIGIISAKFAGGKHHGPLIWIYFSKNPLIDEQIRSLKKPNLPPTDLIMIEYYPDVLNEVLKYIPKDRIRNLHLIEQQIFS